MFNIFRKKSKILYCEECGRRLDRPRFYRLGFYPSCKYKHPEPTKAQEVVEAIEANLTSRYGLDWEGIDKDTLDEIRDALARIIIEYFPNEKEV